jgi:hypothetical protein
MKTSPRTRSARAAGQSQNGGSEALAGNPIRTAATRARSRRCTTALMKLVVPITTPSILPRAISGRRVSSARAVTMPVVTSDVVGVLTACATLPSSAQQHPYWCRRHQYRSAASAYAPSAYAQWSKTERKSRS